MTELVKYEAAERALAAAEATDEVLEIRSQSVAWEAYARQAKNRDLEIRAARIRFRAERRLGEMLIAAKEAGQISRGQPKKNTAETEEYSEGQLPRVTLREAGIDHKLSSRAQQIASMDRAAFEHALERHAEEVRAGVSRVATDLRKIGAEEKGRAHRRDLAAAMSGKTAEMPAGRVYPCFYIDPPWKREGGIGDRAYENHYPTMTWPEILAYLRQARESLLPDAWAFMWIPRAHLLAEVTVERELQVKATGELVMIEDRIPLAWACGAALGVSYSTAFVWTKTDDDHPDVSGSGLIARDQDELLLLFKRGRGLPKPAGSEKFGSNHRERTREHSRKPEFYRHMIATMVGCDSEGAPLPVLEMFARVDAEHPLPPGWDACGNQAAPVDVVPDRAARLFGDHVAAKRARSVWPAGHVVTMTNPVIDGVMRSIGSCACGEVFSFAWGEHDAMDAAIEAHWQDFDAQPEKTDGGGDPIEPSPRLRELLEGDDYGKSDPDLITDSSFAVVPSAGETVTAAADATSEGASPAAAVAEYLALKVLSDFCHPRRGELADVIGPHYQAMGLAYQSGEHWSLRGAGWDRLRELDAAAEPASPRVELTEPFRAPQLSLDLSLSDAPAPLVVDGKLQTRLPVDDDELAEQVALIEIESGRRVEGGMLRHLVGKGLAHCGITKISITDDGRAFLAQLVSPASVQQQGVGAS